MTQKPTKRTTRKGSKVLDYRRAFDKEVKALRYFAESDGVEMGIFEGEAADYGMHWEGVYRFTRNVFDKSRRWRKDLDQAIVKIMKNPKTRFHAEMSVVARRVVGDIQDNIDKAELIDTGKMIDSVEYRFEPHRKVGTK